MPSIYLMGEKAGCHLKRRGKRSLREANLGEMRQAKCNLCSGRRRQVCLCVFLMISVTGKMQDSQEKGVKREQHIFYFIYSWLRHGSVMSSLEVDIKG